MQTPIGFVILVNPFSPLAQTERLIGTLNRMFDFPPIVCHHDFGKNPVFVENCTPNVNLVRPHVNTKWADFSCIEAAIRAMRLLYLKDRGPDWFVYLSGADYPIKSRDQILSDLKNSAFDAYIEHRHVERVDFEDDADTRTPTRFKGAAWLRGCYKRYCSLKVTIPWLTRRFSATQRTFSLNSGLFAGWNYPFSKSFKCYAGEAWWCGNRKAVKVILDFYEHDKRFAEHCKRIAVPEECYFQSVLANNGRLKLSQDCLRYVDWTNGGSHPKTLSLNDIQPMKLTNAHFARKFPGEITCEFQIAVGSLSCE